MIDDNINHEYIIRYIRDTIRPKQGLLSELEKYAEENEVPISQPETIKFIEVLIKLSRAKRILEVGSAIGYSAICMAGAGAETIDTIEIDPRMAELAKSNIEKAGYADKIYVHTGDAVEILPLLVKDFSFGLIDKYDLIFIDAAKAQYGNFFEPCITLLNSGGALISDNVLYKGMTATDELVLHRKRTIVKRLRDYLKTLCRDDRLDTSLLPLGDGVAVSFKI